jgi:parallel beta-helix repeat protein
VPGKAGLALTFDDSCVDDWYSIRGLLNQYGVKATFFIDNPDLLTADQINKLKVLQSDGHEIGCHGWRHLDPLAYTATHSVTSYINVEILPAVSLMQSWGINPVSFAYPYGEPSTLLNSPLLEYFGHLRTLAWPEDNIQIKTLESTYYKFDSQRVLGAVDMDNIFNYPLSLFYGGIDRAKANDEVLLLCGHRVIESTQPVYITPVSKLQAIIQYASANNLRFYTVSQLTPTGTASLMTAIAPVAANDIVVSGKADGYASIQAAINAASGGDTITVGSGTYYENLLVSKAITLKAAPGTSPVIDAQGKNSGLQVSAGATIEGFKVRNAGPSYSGFYVTGSGVTLSDNTISGCGWGIYLKSASNNKLMGNVVTGSTTNGIGLYGSSNNVITGSTTSGNALGLKIDSASSGNVLYRNDFHDTANVAGSQSFSSPTTITYWYHDTSFQGYLGNNWPAYSGTDADGNGVFDTAYSGTTFTDRYPLKESIVNYG